MLSICQFVRPSVRSFFCYQTCEHDNLILKTNEFTIDTSAGLWHETINFEVTRSRCTRGRIDRFGGLTGGISLDSPWIELGFLVVFSSSSSKE